MYLFFLTLFGTLISEIAKIFTKRALITVVIIAGIVTVTGGFFIIISSILNTITTSMPPVVQTAWNMAMPGNIGMCISARLGCDAVIWGYRWQTKFISLYAR